MADVSVNGATWSSIAREEVIAVVDAVLGANRLDVSVSITRPYEGIVGRSLWDVQVEGISLDVVQGVEADLREHRAARHVTEVEEHGSDGCFPKCSCGWVGSSLSPTRENAEERNLRHVAANSRG